MLALVTYRKERDLVAAAAAASFEWPTEGPIMNANKHAPSDK
jgi:hypothetical protein